MSEHANREPDFGPGEVATGRSGLPWPLQVILLLMILGVAIPLQFFLAPRLYFLCFAAMPLAICLAVAGEGNRLLFSGVLVLVGVLAFVGLGAIARISDGDNNVAAGLILFGILPLFPAMLMWLAHIINTRKRRIAGAS